MQDLLGDIFSDTSKEITNDVLYDVVPDTYREQTPDILILSATTESLKENDYEKILSPKVPAKSSRIVLNNSQPVSQSNEGTYCR